MQRLSIFAWHVFCIWLFTFAQLFDYTMPSWLFFKFFYSGGEYHMEFTAFPIMRKRHIAWCENEKNYSLSFSLAQIMVWNNSAKTLHCESSSEKRISSRTLLPLSSSLEQNPHSTLSYTLWSGRVQGEVEWWSKGDWKSPRASKEDFGHFLFDQRTMINRF